MIKHNRNCARQLACLQGLTPMCTSSNHRASFLHLKTNAMRMQMKLVLQETVSPSWKGSESRKHYLSTTIECLGRNRWNLGREFGASSDNAQPHKCQRCRPVPLPFYSQSWRRSLLIHQLSPLRS